MHFLHCFVNIHYIKWGPNNDLQALRNSQCRVTCICVCVRPDVYGAYKSVYVWNVTDSFGQRDKVAMINQLECAGKLSWWRWQRGHFPTQSWLSPVGGNESVHTRVLVDPTHRSWLMTAGFFNNQLQSCNAIKKNPHL